MNNKKLRDKMTKELELLLDKAKSGKAIITSINYTHHTSYDQNNREYTIEMIDFCDEN